MKARFLAILLAMFAGAALPFPAHAQFFGNWGFGGGWGQSQPYRRQAPPRRFLFPFFGRPYAPRPSGPPPDASRAPPPHKPETTPTRRVAVVGDSMADWLAYGLEEVYADQPQIGIVRDVRPYSGLVHYEPRNETLEWSQVIKDTLATQKPAAIIVMLGLDDRLPLRAPPPVQTPPPPQKGKDGNPQQTPPAAEQKPAVAAPAAAAQQHPVPGETYDFRTADWAKLYAKRIDAMIAALKSMNVPVLWVGLPAIRGTRGTADMSYLDDLYHAAADKAGITYVDIWDGFVDENGRYSVEGPDFEGQTRRLRTPDGVHFSKYGALKLAHLVDQDLSRVLANPAVAVAVPSQAAPAKPGATKSAIGPVLPLTAAGGGGSAYLNGVDSANLLGSGGQTAPSDSENSTVNNVLVRGDPVNAPAGRADDFAWPPRAPAAVAPPHAPDAVAPPSVPVTPATIAPPPVKP